MTARDQAASIEGLDALWGPIRALCLLAVLAAGTGALAAERPLLLHTPPANPTLAQPLELDGSLLHGAQVETVVLHYRNPGEEWRETKMELQYGDVFRGVVPGDHVVPPAIEYFVDGVTVRGEHLPLLASSLRPIRIHLEGELPARPPPPAQKTTSTPPVVIERGTPERTPPRTEPEPETRRPPEPTPEPEPPPARTVTRNPETTSQTHRAPSHPASSGDALADDLEVFGAEDTTALELKAAQDATHATNLTTVLTREEMRALGARNVYDALDFVPGLTVSRDVQGFYRVGVRGIRSEPEVLFLLNGHPLNNFYDGKAMANLPIDNLARIEITRGPGSAENGASAFLAVINIVTDESVGARGSFVYGSFGTLDAHASAATHPDKWEIFGDADYLQQSGYTLNTSNDSLTAERAKQGLAANETTHDKRQLINVGAGVGYHTDGGLLTLRLRFQREDRLPLLGMFDTVSPGGDLRWTTFLGDLSYEQSLSSTIKGRFQIYADNQAIDRRFLLSPTNYQVVPNAVSFPDGVQEEQQASTLDVGGKAGFDFTLASTNTLGAALQVASQSVKPVELTNYDLTTLAALGTGLTPQGAFAAAGSSSYASSRLDLAAVVSDHWVVVPRLIFDLGARFALTQLPTLKGDAFGGTKLVPNLNPRATISFVAADALTFKVSYAHAFRAPTQQELALQVPDNDLTRGRFEGKPALVASQIDTVELGADSVQSIGPALLTLKASAFFSGITDPIIAIDTTGEIPPVDNYQSVHIFGAEGEAKLKISPRALGWVNASWFRANLVAPSQTPSEFSQLTDTPQARLNAGLTVPIGSFLDADVAMDFGVQRESQSLSALELIRPWSIPDYCVVNAQLRTEPLWGHLELAVVGRNVFNVQLTDDVPRPDRVTGLLPREGLSVMGMVRVFE